MIVLAIVLIAGMYVTWLNLRDSTHDDPAQED